MLFAVVGSSIAASIPYIYGRLVDLVSIQATDLSFILALLGIWFLMDIVSNFFNRFVRLKGNSLSVDISNDLICESSKHILSLPLKFHKEKKLGAIFSKIERAAEFLGRIIQNTVFWILPEFLTVFAGIIILFFIEWKLAIGMIFLCLIFILVSLYKTIPIIETQKKLNKAAETATGNLYDAFLNIQTIKSCAVEDFQIQRTKKDFYQKLGPVLKN
ncbi:ABC transporter ATP-binding protein [Candidatus Parcubacteria bacterium]|nr:ABC transporter ATP-binding protein [Candidatus Parcubacteria bacterium]